MYYFEDLSQMFHQRFGHLPVNWAGFICVWGRGGGQQSIVPLNLVYLNLHSLIQQMPTEQLICIRHYNIYTNIFKAWSLGFASGDDTPR